MAAPHTTPQRTTELRLARARWRTDETVPLLEDVIAFARVAYTGLTDAAGHAAIEHPLRIMDAVSSDDARIVAVLHDTLLHEAILHDGSGSPTLARDLRSLVSDRLTMAIAAFSHSGGGIDGISAELIAGDPLALEVELACLADLTDPARLAELDPFSRRRLEASCAASARALGSTLQRYRPTNGLPSATPSAPGVRRTTPATRTEVRRHPAPAPPASGHSPAAAKLRTSRLD
jgi:hypothetical protein